MVITGGVNVYPAEVENIAMRIPGVSAAMAFACPDPLCGDRIELAVVAKSGNFLASALVLNQLRDGLVSSAVPKAIHILPELPLTEAGKPDRKKLRSQLFGAV